MFKDAVASSLELVRLVPLCSELESLISVQGLERRSGAHVQFALEKK